MSNTYTSFLIISFFLCFFFFSFLFSLPFFFFLKLIKKRLKFRSVLLNNNRTSIVRRQFVAETGTLFDNLDDKEESGHVHSASCNHTIHDKQLSKIFEQNAAWHEDIVKNDPEFFNKLGATHTPRYFKKLLLCLIICFFF